MSQPVIEAVIEAPPAAPLAAQPPARATVAVAAHRSVVPAQAARAVALVHYGLRRTGAATLVGVAAGTLAVALFISTNLPLGNSVNALQSQLQRVHSLSASAGGARTPGGIALAALPARGDAPELVGKILEEARASGVDLPRGQYEYMPARDGMAPRYRMSFPLHASYPKIREFMDRTLVAMPAVAVEGLRIERKTVGDDGVDVELRLSAYVRGDE